MTARWLLPLCLCFIQTAMAAGAQSFDCWYSSKKSGAFEEQRACTVEKDGKLTISPEHLKKMAFDGQDGSNIKGLAAVRLKDASGYWYYAKPTGEMLSVITFDNGPEAFIEGLVRSRVNGKIAWFDQNFKMVIGPRYDWGSFFENGRAAVCNGCVQGKYDEEHWIIRGGRNGFIDRKGREVVPLK